MTPNTLGICRVMSVVFMTLMSCFDWQPLITCRIGLIVHRENTGIILKVTIFNPILPTFGGRSGAKVKLISCGIDYVTKPP